MTSREVTIVNASGLHARPSAALVKLAASFKSDVFLDLDGYQVNAKSILGVMTLAADQGSTIILRAEGPDEEDVIDAIEELFKSGFNEI